MATFEAQVEGLTSLAIDGSSAPTQSELTQFLTDGAKEIINNMPKHMLPLCSASQSFTSGSADTLNTGKILNVLRSDGDISQPCRKITSKEKGRASDPDEMSYATITDPVFFIDNNTIDVLPAGGSCTYSEVQYPAVAYSASAISVFPDEAEHLVVLYGAVKSLQNALGNKAVSLNNSDEITTALSAVNAQADQAVTALANVGTNIALAKQEVDDALTEIAEAISLTDSTSSDIKTAVDAMKTANAKFRADGQDPALFGDDSAYHTSDKALTKVKVYVDRAISYINGDFPNANYDLSANLADIDAELTNEDTELATGRIQQLQATLNAVDTDLKIARTYTDEWNTLVDTLIKEINSFSSEVSSRVNWISAKAQVWNAELASARGYMETVNGYISQANGFNATSQAYANEVQSRLQVHTAQYTWYEKQQAKLQADYDKGLGALK